MTADEMFEVLGYKKINELNYIGDCGNHKCRILFNDIFFEVLYEHYNEDWEEWEVGFMTMQELKAVYKKCEEMGWIK